MTEWERQRERDQFTRTRHIYQPLAVSLSTRFTREAKDEEVLEMTKVCMRVGLCVCVCDISSFSFHTHTASRTRFSPGCQSKHVRCFDEAGFGMASTPCPVQEIQCPRPIPQVSYTLNFVHWYQCLVALIL